MIRNRPFAAAQELKQRNEELARRVGELQSMLDSTNSALNKEMAQSLDARAKIEQAMPMPLFKPTARAQPLWLSHAFPATADVGWRRRTGRSGSARSSCSRRSS